MCILRPKGRCLKIGYEDFIWALYAHCYDIQFHYYKHNSKKGEMVTVKNYFAVCGLLLLASNILLRKKEKNL